jgi:hypothetical protein
MKNIMKKKSHEYNDGIGRNNNNNTKNVVSFLRQSFHYKISLGTKRAFFFRSKVPSWQFQVYYYQRKLRSMYGSVLLGIIPRLDYSFHRP